MVVATLACNTVEELGFGILVHNLDLNNFFIYICWGPCICTPNSKQPFGVRVGQITQHTCTGFKVYCLGT